MTQRKHIRGIKRKVRNQNRGHGQNHRNKRADYFVQRKYKGREADIRLPLLDSLRKEIIGK